MSQQGYNQYYQGQYQQPQYQQNQQYQQPGFQPTAAQGPAPGQPVYQQPHSGQTGYQQQPAGQPGYQQPPSGFQQPPTGFQSGYPPSMPPQTTQQASGLHAHTYSAYPEHDPQFQFQNRSYQEHSLAGWNDPPVVLKSKPVVDLSKVEAPERTIVSIITALVDQVKVTQGGNRIFIDSEKRLDTLFDKLGSGLLDKDCLAGLYVVCTSIQNRDFVSAKQEITKLMTAWTQETKWLLGLKRVVDLV